MPSLPTFRREKASTGTTRRVEPGLTITLDDYLDDWLERKQESLRPTTVDNYRNNLRRYLPDRLRTKRIAEITPLALSNTYDRLVRGGGLGGKPLSAQTVVTFHHVMHSAFEDALRDGLIPTNPATRARVPRYDRTGRGDFQIGTWTVDQLATFLDFADRRPFGELWRVAAFTALSRSELLGLTWSLIDFDARRIDVRRALIAEGHGNFALRRSSRVPRVIAIGKETAAILRSQRRRQTSLQKRAQETWRNELDLVFTTENGQPVHPVTLTYRFRELVAETGLPQIRLQDLRNTHAAVLLQTGVPFHLVMQRIGIGDPWTAMRRYGHFIPPSDTGAAETFERLLDAVEIS